MTPPKRSDPDDAETQLVARLQAFANDWRNYQSTERAGAQPFLAKLLEIYEVEAKPGTIFEQHPIRIPSTKKRSRQGALFAEGDVEVEYEQTSMDMYLPRICVWEMKAPDEKLEDHHDQVLGYWARMRTRYMVLCNFHDFWIYDTDDENGQLHPKLQLKLQDLPSHPHALRFLRGEEANLGRRAETVTAHVASALGRIVRDSIHASKNPDRDRERIARVVLECVFAMFAEDTDLIPANMFTDTMRRAHAAGSLDPMWTLFADFAKERPSERRNHLAPYVNGPLFQASHQPIELSKVHIGQLLEAARDFDWQDVRPEIFGTIFEQALDPMERHELGAHYTRQTDIERVILPTIIEPWRDRILALRHPKEAEALIEQLKGFHVLDPACGCGDFLYVVYREMKRLEASLLRQWHTLQRRVAKRRADLRPPPPGPWFTVRQLHGIEINDFAAFLARVVLWIGEHLASRELDLDEPILPLKNLTDTIVHGDALALPWPRPEGELAIVGNPPYLGVRKLRLELGDEYVERLFERYPDNRAADFVTYWFTRARETLRSGERAGFVATNSIAQNESREASLDRLAAAGATITDAWRSYPWPGDAAVHVAIVNWVMGPWDGARRLDGADVPTINTALTSAADVTAARHLVPNENLCFMGVTPGNKEFILTAETRAALLDEDPRSKAVIKPFLIGLDVNRAIDQQPSRWIIDLGLMDKGEAEAFPAVMKHLRKHVYSRKHGDTDRKTAGERKRWWQFVRPRPELRTALTDLGHALVMPRVGPHLIISRQETTVAFDCQLMVVTLPSHYHFAVLQSALHARWARARGSTFKGDLRYTNTTIFETFPFPLLPDGTYDPRKVPTSSEARRAAVCGQQFERVRANACRNRNLGLTKLHNLLVDPVDDELGRAYVALNEAVCELYGFPPSTWRDQDATLGRLLDLNRKVASL